MLGFWRRSALGLASRPTSRRHCWAIEVTCARCSPVFGLVPSPPRGGSWTPCISARVSFRSVARLVEAKRSFSRLWNVSSRRNGRLHYVAQVHAHEHIVGAKPSFSRISAFRRGDTAISSMTFMFMQMSSSSRRNGRFHDFSAFRRGETAISSMTSMFMQMSFSSRRNGRFTTLMRFVEAKRPFPA